MPRTCASARRSSRRIVDSYRKLRNTLRFLLGALDGITSRALPVGFSEMPELERYMLHAPCRARSRSSRAGYDAFDFKRVFHALFNFCVNDLSAFYFDIRKDALYCDPYDSTRGARRCTVLDIVFPPRSTAWLAPMLAFTMEEAWLNRFPGEASSVHLAALPRDPARLARRGARREMAQGAGASAAWSPARSRSSARQAHRLEPRSRAEGPCRRRDLREALAGVDLAEVAITSGIEADRRRRARRSLPPRRRARRRRGLRAARKGRNARAPGKSLRTSAPIPSFPSFPRATPRLSGNSMPASARGGGVGPSCDISGDRFRRSGSASPR